MNKAILNKKIQDLSKAFRVSTNINDTLQKENTKLIKLFTYMLKTDTITNEKLIKRICIDLDLFDKNEIDKIIAEIKGVKIIEDNKELDIQVCVKCFAVSEKK